MLNMNSLYSFYICAEHLNISKAATILGISQPSLSMQIKNLEAEIGTPLFLRNGKSISLTTKGKELLGSSSLFFELKDEISTILEKKKEKKREDYIRILVSEEIERPFVAEVVAKLAKKENVRMSISSANEEEALEKAENDEMDFFISHESFNTKWNHVRVDFPVFFATSSELPLSPTFDHPANIQKVVDYFGEDLIIPASDIKLGKEFLTFRKKNGIKRNVILESNIVSCLVRFVASGAGCSFLPLPYIKSSFYQNHIHLIGPRQGFWKHSVYIYSRLPKAKLETHPLVKHIRTYGSL